MQVRYMSPAGLAGAALLITALFLEPGARGSRADGAGVAGAEYD